MERSAGTIGTDIARVERLERSVAVERFERLEQPIPVTFIAIILFQTCSLLDKAHLLRSQTMVTFN